MANTTDLQHRCGECTFFNHGYCAKTRMKTPKFTYACSKFMTDEQYIAERNARNNERLERNEVRFNFMLTALEISATTTHSHNRITDTLQRDKT